MTAHPQSMRNFKINYQTDIAADHHNGHPGPGNAEIHRGKKVPQEVLSAKTKQ